MKSVLRIKTYHVFAIFLLCIISISLKGQSIEELQSGLEKSRSEGNTVQEAGYLSKIAYYYWQSNQSQPALEYFNKALAANKSIGNRNAIKTIHSNLGMIYSDIGNFSQALSHFEESLRLKRSGGRKGEIVSELMNVGNTKIFLGQASSAKDDYLEALGIAKELQNTRLIRSCYLKLAEAHQKLGNAEKANEYMQLYTTFEKQVQQEIMAQKEEQSEMEKNILAGRVDSATNIAYDKELKLKAAGDTLERMREYTSKQEMMIDILNKEKEITELKRKEERARSIMTRNYLIGVILFVLIIAVIIFRNYRMKQRANALLAKQNTEIKKQKEAIDEQHLQIRNSITYAQRIQEAMLPMESQLLKTFPESFIFFRPRDVVSGDFYFFSKTRDKNDKMQYYISAIDCTGHGVPGAFMSLIGHTILTDIIKEGTTEPDIILNKLHKQIRYSLKQHKTDNRDGMDMSLCVIKEEGRVVEFAGAKNPVIYIQNNEQHIIKGDFVPIGGLQMEEERVFKKHIIEVKEPTMFYLFSDGYMDQFGGEIGDKYMSRNFYKLLHNIHNEPTQIQKDILSKTLEEWQGPEYKQIDDILVMGFKLG